MVPQFLQHPQEKQWLHLDGRMWGSLATIKKLPYFRTIAFKAARRRKIVWLPRCVWTFYEYRSHTRRWRKKSPIYYVSKVLLDVETRYNQLEKLALALFTAARKLKPYFQSHPITVLTSFPLKNIQHKPELSGRLTKWVIELSKHHIDYQPRITIKSQVLADFIADFSPCSLLQAQKELMTLK